MMAEKIFDYDLKAHLEALESYHIKKNDFVPIPLRNVEHDFVNELLVRYLQDTKNRMKEKSFGNATPAMILRKCIKLTDIDDMVEEC